MTLEFRVLGPLEMIRAGQPVPLGGPRQRALLAALLLEAGRTVSVAQLTAALWDQHPPGNARATIQTHILRLRRTLAGDADLSTQPDGYRLTPPAGTLDLTVFRDLVADAATAQTEGRLEEAAAALTQALAHWRGPALDGVTGDRLRYAAIPRLTEERLRALEDRIDLDLRLGRHAQLIAELEGLVAEHPQRQRLHGQAMLALYRCGRQAEALASYQRIRRLLTDEYGLEPGQELRDLHQAVLADDPALRPATADPQAPRQLPPRLPDFTGRDPEVERLGSLLADPATPLAVVSGPPGIGKSALAVHVAHQVADRFPDGQLHLDLRGDAGRPVPARQLLGRLLRDLGPDGATVPAGLTDRIRAWRQRLTGRRVLLVLDNAHDEAQVRPLLPPDGSAVVVTARSPLAGLEGARWLPLEAMDQAAAGLLLHRIAGQRVEAEPQAAETVLALCGGLPLAVRICGAKLAARPHWTLADLAERLTDQRHRLDELTAGDLTVRATLNLAYRGLSAEARRCLRLISLLGPVSFQPWVVAALCGPPDEAVPALADAQLVEPASRGADGRLRYRLHDLTRLFAAERLQAEEPADAVVAAVGRAVAAAHRRTVTALGQLMPVEALPVGAVETDATDATDTAAACGEGTALGPAPGSEPSPGAALGRGSGPGSVGSALRPALDALAAEQTVVTALLEQAERHQLGRPGWALALAHSTYCEIRAQWGAWGHVLDAALRSATAAEDRFATATILLRLADLRLDQGLADLAAEQYQRAMALLAPADAEHPLDPADQSRAETARAAALVGLGHALHTSGRYQAALDALAEAATSPHHAGDGFPVAGLLRARGRCHAELGHHQQAVEELARSLTLHQRYGAHQLLPYLLRELAMSESALGQAEAAVAHLEQGLTCADDLGDQRARAYLLRGLALVHAEHGRPEPALRAATAALTVVERLGEQIGAVQTRRLIGDLHAAAGDHRTAVDHLEAALRGLDQVDYPRVRGYVLHSLGSAWNRLGVTDRATELLDQAIGIFRELDMTAEAAAAERERGN